MRADAILRQVLAGVGDHVHQRRLSAVIDAVHAVVEGGQVALSALGRSLARTSQKHGIKRADRLLGNETLADEVELFYRAILARVLPSTTRPVILVDWTETGRTTCALTAAVPVQGRAVVIHTMTVALSNWTSRALEDLFLEQLRAMLGADRKPILVGDAGFRAPWMQAVKAMGWDFVTRIRGRTQIRRTENEAWQSWRALWPKARTPPRALGAFAVTKDRRIEANLVVVDQRSARARSATLKPRRAVQLRSAKAHREPLLLATTLDLPAKQVAAIYAARMQIELAFRDLKSCRYGWGFELARCRSVSRVAIQIMLASLASFVCLLVGIALEAAGRHKAFQANTETRRRVLSFICLGHQALRRSDAAQAPPLHVLTGGLARRLPFAGIR